MTALCLLCAWRLAPHAAEAHSPGAAKSSDAQSPELRAPRASLDSARGLHGPVVFFAGFAATAFWGGTWHGFLSGAESPAGEIVWWLTMLCAGATAAGLAFTGLELLGVQRHRWVVPAAGVLLVSYAVWTWRDPRFLVSLVASATGTAVCIAGLIHRLRGPDNTGARPALAGFGLSMLAAIAQQQGVALHPVHFDHNATYHLALLPALGLVYAGFQRMSSVR